jgi:hypothetical protein
LRTTKPHPTRQSISFPAGSNVAQAFGHVAQAWAKYQCQSHAQFPKGTADKYPAQWVEDPMAKDWVMPNNY